MESSTSGGSNEPRKASTRASTRSATETAFAPLRFETASVTAGHRAGSPAEADLTYCDGSSLPSWTRATSPKNTGRDRKSTRLNSSHVEISYAVFCLKKKKKKKNK